MTMIINVDFDINKYIPLNCNCDELFLAFKDDCFWKFNIYNYSINKFVYKDLLAFLHQYMILKMSYHKNILFILAEKDKIHYLLLIELKMGLINKMEIGNFYNDIVNDDVYIFIDNINHVTLKKANKWENSSCFIFFDFAKAQISIRRLPYLVNYYPHNMIGVVHCYNGVMEDGIGDKIYMYASGIKDENLNEKIVLCDHGCFNDYKEIISCNEDKSIEIQSVNECCFFYSIVDIKESAKTYLSEYRYCGELYKYDFIDQTVKRLEYNINKLIPNVDKDKLYFCESSEIIEVSSGKKYCIPKNKYVWSIDKNLVRLSFNEYFDLQSGNYFFLNKPHLRLDGNIIIQNM